ncbi:hypothetical protein ACIF80_10580 [Streptomyces sp. NPDC085927]|uniref:hypothetical protein n=1 Tax=Streptomyces sp. NPDC085927 TaxID=3365738 RepID=UPI0037D7A8B2
MRQALGECRRGGAVGRTARQHMAAAPQERCFLTTDPDDFKGLDDLLTAVPVTRPKTPHES